MISLCLQDENGARGRWSAAVGIVELGESVLKLWPPQPPQPDGASAGGTFVVAPFVLRVEVTLVGATVLVHLSPNDKATPPYRLINRVRAAVHCNQVGVTTVTTRVPPSGSAAYVLDAPSLPPLLQLSLPELAKGPLTELNLSRIGEQTSFAVPVSDEYPGIDDGKERAPLRIFCLVEAEGPTKVITFAEAPLLSAEVALVEESHHSAKERFQLSVPHLGLSLIDESP